VPTLIYGLLVDNNMVSLKSIARSDRLSPVTCHHLQPATTLTSIQYPVSSIQLEMKASFTALFALATSLFTMASPGDAFSSSENSNSQPPQEPNQVQQHQQELLQLPPSDPNDTAIKTLQMGQSMPLENLGPIIINTDGTTRRIENWDALTEREREVSWRRIKKRNAERKEMLEEQQKELLENLQTEEDLKKE